MTALRAASCCGDLIVRSPCGTSSLLANVRVSDCLGDSDVNRVQVLGLKERATELGHALFRLVAWGRVSLLGADKLAAEHNGQLLDLALGSACNGDLKIAGVLSPRFYLASSQTEAMLDLSGL